MTSNAIQVVHKNASDHVWHPLSSRENWLEQPNRPKECVVSVTWACPCGEFFSKTSKKTDWEVRGE